MFFTTSGSLAKAVDGVCGFVSEVCTRRGRARRKGLGMEGNRGNGTSHSLILAQVRVAVQTIILRSDVSWEVFVRPAETKRAPKR